MKTIIKHFSYQNICRITILNNHVPISPRILFRAIFVYLPSVPFRIQGNRTTCYTISQYLHYCSNKMLLIVSTCLETTNKVRNKHHQRKYRGYIFQRIGNPKTVYFAIIYFYVFTNVQIQLKSEPVYLCDLQKPLPKEVPQGAPPEYPIVGYFLIGGSKGISFGEVGIISERNTQKLPQAYRSRRRIERKFRMSMTT